MSDSTIEYLDKLEKLAEVPMKERQRGMRRHGFMPKDYLAMMPKQNGTEIAADPIAYVKWFCPYGSGTWYVCDVDPETGLCFCWVDLDLGPGFAEYGDVYIFELESMVCNLWGRKVPAIERDKSWLPTRMSQVLEGKVR